MSRKELSYAERADRERRRARRNRTVSVVMFVLAGVFIIGGIVLVVVTGSPKLLTTIVSGATLGICGLSMRLSASTQDFTAERFDRLARGGY